jgi:hypothetical protein
VENAFSVSRARRPSHRRYPRAVLRRVAFIVFAQWIGMTLDENPREMRDQWRRLGAGPRFWLGDRGLRGRSGAP